MKFSIIKLVWCATLCVSMYGMNKVEQLKPAAGDSIEAYHSKITALVNEQNRYNPDTKRKFTECVELVDKGIKHILSVGIEAACYDFIYKNDWRRGEIFNAVVDSEGYFLCHGDDVQLIWKKMESNNFIEEPIFETIKKTEDAGQWIHYIWHNGFKTAFVKRIVMENSPYFIISGYFPQAKDYIAQRLVDSAISYFKKTPPATAFTRISNPNDMFVIGDISMYVGDSAGTILADSIDTAFIGQDALNTQSAAGDYFMQNIIRGLKRSPQFFLDVNWLHDVQRNYIKKFFDSRSAKEYFFAAGYYPNIDETVAADLLRDAILHINSEGTTKAFSDISNPLGKFIKGRSSIAVYDFEGTLMASSQHAALIGQNLIDSKDVNDKYIVQDLIKLAKTYGQGIIPTKEKNSYELILFKVIDTPQGKYIVLVNVYVQSKELGVQVLVDKAIRFLRKHSLFEGLERFADPTGEFYVGDLYIFVYSADGTAFVNGDQKSMTWQDYSVFRNKEAQFTVESLGDLAKKGGGWMTYPSRNAERRVFIQPINVLNKDSGKEELFLIGSGYYL